MPDITAALSRIFLVAFAIDALVFGLPALWLAGEKGRSPLAWAFVGLFIGPLAILILGLAPRGASGRFGECPACREVIRLEASLCPYCRTRFADAVVADEWDPVLNSTLGVVDRRRGR